MEQFERSKPTGRNTSAEKVEALIVRKEREVVLSGRPTCLHTAVVFCSKINEARSIRKEMYFINSEDRANEALAVVRNNMPTVPGLIVVLAWYVWFVIIKVEQIKALLDNKCKVRLSAKGFVESFSVKIVHYHIW